MRAAVDDAPRHCRRSLRDHRASLRPPLTGPLGRPESTCPWVVRLSGSRDHSGWKALGTTAGPLPTDTSRHHHGRDAGLIRYEQPTDRDRTAKVSAVPRGGRRHELLPGAARSDCLISSGANSHDQQSGWPDLNRRPSAPKADALPTCATSRRPRHSLRSLPAIRRDHSLLTRRERPRATLWHDGLRAGVAQW